MLLLRKKTCPQDFHADIFGQFSGIFFEMNSERIDVAPVIRFLAIDLLR